MLLNENTRKWVAALRSGKYAQTQRYLKRVYSGMNNPSYCCLGVACELYAEEHGLDWTEYTLRVGISSFLGEASILPVQVQRWLGLHSSGGSRLQRSGEWGTAESDAPSLTNLNDTGKDFNYIADYIEEYANELFKIT